MSGASNRLAVLAAEIRAAHSDVASAGQVAAERSLAAGRALIEAKPSVPHGGWGAWCRDHAGLNPRTARFYMQLARSGLETATVADLGLRGAVEMLAEAKFRMPEDGYYLHAITATQDQAMVWPAGDGRFHTYLLDGPFGSGDATNKRSIPAMWVEKSLILFGFPPDQRFEHARMDEHCAAFLNELREAVLRGAGVRQ